MSDGGKGSSPRPFSVDKATFDSNWDRVFNKTKPVENKLNQAVLCHCGRSTTGYCNGLHDMTEDEYDDYLLTQFDNPDQVGN
jgi:CDGSH-type Zn-finger protein